MASFVAFLALLPLTMLRHIFTSPLNMYLSDRDRPIDLHDIAPFEEGDRRFFRLGAPGKKDAARRFAVEAVHCTKAAVFLLLLQECLDTLF